MLLDLLCHIKDIWISDLAEIRWYIIDRWDIIKTTELNFQIMNDNILSTDNHYDTLKSNSFQMV